ncbi:MULTISPECIES: C4-dicarboxylate transporter DctA [Brucella/Ochrobactrum group]|uniref:C4-dicarboxylate transporter DctA n=1 Tax=Ochrobactrum teleogrylli TaxID=2479765 RepID=A0ABD5K2W8_9HYPH|nr:MULTISPECIES: C4-dicarboxylate transporter DctA [Brucella/Ochrobactrum group]MBA8845822.1 Na+/H+-dicarboxylate symporter [Ochrobactrum sp. RH1CCR137]MBA8857543.1 Na+/H+-dicarboxylate symporter [Ochrobactrum sp. RH1CCR134]UXO86164.1 C4-dicarboxylate transporter DctA [Brucella intermedia]
MARELHSTNSDGEARKSIVLHWLSKLYVQVIIGVLIGTTIGYFEPQIAVAMKPLGDVFIRAIKAIVTPIIFLTIVVGIATIGDMRKVASIGVKAIIYFEVASTIALLIGLAVGNIWPVGRGINADPATLDAGAVSTFVQKSHDVTLVDFFINIIPQTFLSPFVSGEILPVLFVAVLFGLALCKIGDKAKPLISLLETASYALFGMVNIIMRFAPLGAAGAMAFTIGKYGLGSLLELGQLVLAVYVVSILFVVIVLGAFLRIAGFSLWKVLSYFKDEILVVFAATSAETMIPRSMAKLEHLGVRKEVIGLVMPTGFSFNMDGTAIYMTMATLFIAHATNTELTLWHQLTILLIMLFTSKGAAGVTGGGFIALAATLPSIGVLPVAGLALLVGVDRFMAEIRAATNLTSNIIATLVVGRWVGAIDNERAQSILDCGEMPDEKQRAETVPIGTPQRAGTY